MTDVTSVKSVPVRVTLVPTAPACGEYAVIVGAAIEKTVFATAVPANVVTRQRP